MRPVFAKGRALYADSEENHGKNAEKNRQNTDCVMHRSAVGYVDAVRVARKHPCQEHEYASQKERGRPRPARRVAADAPVQSKGKARHRNPKHEENAVHDRSDRAPGRPKLAYVIVGMIVSRHERAQHKHGCRKEQGTGRTERKKVLSTSMPPMLIIR